MKHERIPIRTDPPPPLVPQSVRGWVAPLGRAVLAAIGISLCYLMVLITRQGQLLGDTAARHH